MISYGRAWSRGSLRMRSSAAAFSATEPSARAAEMGGWFLILCGSILCGIILCGIGLAGACFRSEYVLLRELGATERRKERVMRELRIKRLSSQVESEHFAQTG